MRDLMTPELTMTSRELADLVEKRHDNVKRTIETLAERGVIASPQIEEKPDTGGRPATEYRVGKRDSYVIVAQLSPEFTARLVDRWQELEARVSAPALPDPMQAVNDPKWLRAALLGYSEKVMALEATVEAQAPKVAALERLAASEGSMCLRDAAAHLDVRERVFTLTLNAHGWIYLRPGKRGWLAHAESLRRGVLEYKCHTYTDSKDGQEKVNEQVMVTTYGLTRLAELLVKWGIKQPEPA